MSRIPTAWRLPAAAAALALGLAGCGEAPQQDAPRATPVRVVEVERSPLAAGIRAVGTVAPAEEVRLSFKTGGVVAAIDVAQGERIRAGQRLASVARDEVEAAVAQARAMVDKAGRDLERGEALYADEVATREQVEDLRTARDVAAASLRAAEFNARFAVITAPGDGVVLRRLAEPGELVAAGQPVLVVGNTRGGWIVRAHLPDRDIVRVEAGEVARVTLDAFPGRSFEATVTEVSSAADPLTGTYEVKLAIDPQGLRFVQGLVAKIELPGEDGAAALPVVPVESLLEANGSTAVVFLVAAGDTEDDVARRVEVRLGQWVGTRVEVLEGVTEGDRVVTEGAAYLHDGEAVRILPRA
ncbi:MAG: efflux RND transporter periplasmic adaptor subunit [Steroidobacteraceae bacterium]|jgi:RND family efflux transporter MFP subunit|nr:efflux RND transporter periplasmic adaptor subunit [Steroidobacteraceae bacterium]